MVFSLPGDVRKMCAHIFSFFWVCPSLFLPLPIIIRGVGGYITHSFSDSRLNHYNLISASRWGLQCPYEARYEADFRFFEILVNMVNAVNMVNVVNMVIGVFFLHVFSFVTRQSAGKHGKSGKHGKHVVHCTSAFFNRQTAGKHGKRGKHGKLDNFSPCFSSCL